MISFTQFFRPDGRRKENYINRPKDIEDKASQLIEAGFKFEIEVLSTGHVHMDCSHDDHDENPFASKICLNSSEVLTAVDELVKEAYEKLIIIEKPLRYFHPARGKYQTSKQPFTRCPCNSLS